jgi:hypothetical protein
MMLNLRRLLVAIFYTNAGHATLHDAAYNPDRNIATRNPYKRLIADLQKRGVRVDLCGATAKVPREILIFFLASR